MNRKGMIKAIWAISHNIGIDKETIYSLLYRETGQEHISSCTDEELKSLLKITDKLKPDNKVFNRITDSQKRYIKSLERSLGWDSDSKRLQGFIKRIAKVDRLEWLTTVQASNVIEGLKSISKRSEKGAANE